jgi:hypothetical protein
MLVSYFAYFSTMKREATYSSETSVVFHWTIRLHVLRNSNEYSGSITASAVRIPRLRNFNIYFHEFSLFLKENSIIVTSTIFPRKYWLMENFQIFCSM